MSIQTALLEAKSLAEAEDLELVVTVYPVLVGMDDSYAFTGIHDTIETICGTEQIQILELLDSELWVHPLDQHPNEYANRIAGRSMADFLTRVVSPAPQ